MDYKKIIKNQAIRIKILQFFSFVPDLVMLELQYLIKTGRFFNYKSPNRYTEKIQLYKMNYRDELMSLCADKYDVRNYVKERIGEVYLNKLYGVYSSFDEIDFEALPNQFVLKDTLGSGDASMIICLNKETFDYNCCKNIVNRWVNEPIENKNPGREWVYEGKKHRIIAEKLLISDENGDLPDYKFFCFDGVVFCSYKMENYTMHHDKGRLGFFDREFNLLKVRRADFDPITVQPEKPKNYSKMVELAEKLSKEFPHVRVDFYNIDGKIIFGEMTFFNASGYVNFVPDDFDFQLGNQFKLKGVF